jgi:hypothetical protein
MPLRGKFSSAIPNVAVLKARKAEVADARPPAYALLPNRSLKA